MRTAQDPMQFRAVIVAAVAIAGFACGASDSSRSPTAPTRAEPLALSGTWTGFIKLVSCPSSPSCDGYHTNLAPFMLMIEESQGTWRGTVEVRVPLPFKLDLTGTRQSDGTVLFSGATVSPTVTQPRATISALRVEADSQRGITGSIDYTWRDIGQSARDQPFTGEIPSASRGATLPPDDAATLAGGTWTGEIRFDGCSGSPCGVVGFGTSYQLVVRNAGRGSVNALLRLELEQIVVDLAGPTEADGSVRFSGSFQSAGPTNFTQRVDITHFVVRPDGGTGLTGSFEYTSESTSPYGSQVAVRTGRILSGTRRTVTASPGDFQGSFRGAVAVRHCDGDCEYAKLGAEMDSQWNFVQTGTSVTGQLLLWIGGSMFVPLTGVASGAQLRASGEAARATCQAEYDSAPACSERIRDLSVTVDEFGRLRGTFEYAREGFSGFRRYRYTAAMEFWTVIRQ
jgi:hypothetical protein